jgi:hypothetical protein
MGFGLGGSYERLGRATVEGHLSHVAYLSLFPRRHPERYGEDR